MMYHLKSSGNQFEKICGIYPDAESAIGAIRSCLGDDKDKLVIRFEKDEFDRDVIFLRFDKIDLIIRDFDSIVERSQNRKERVVSRIGISRYYNNAVSAHEALLQGDVYEIGYLGDYESYDNDAFHAVCSLMGVPCERIFSEHAAKSVLAGFAAWDWYGREEPSEEHYKQGLKGVLNRLQVQIAVIETGIYESLSGEMYAVKPVDEDWNHGYCCSKSFEELVKHYEALCETGKSY